MRGASDTTRQSSPALGLNLSGARSVYACTNLRTGPSIGRRCLLEKRQNSGLGSLRDPEPTDESSLQTGFGNESYEAATGWASTPRVCEMSGGFGHVSLVGGAASLELHSCITRRMVAFPPALVSLYQHETTTPSPRNCVVEQAAFLFFIVWYSVRPYYDDMVEFPVLGLLNCHRGKLLVEAALVTPLRRIGTVDVPANVIRRDIIRAGDAMPAPNRSHSVSDGGQVALWRSRRSEGIEPPCLVPAYPARGRLRPDAHCQYVPTRSG